MLAYPAGQFELLRDEGRDGVGDIVDFLHCNCRCTLREGYHDPLKVPPSEGHPDQLPRRNGRFKLGWNQVVEGLGGNGRHIGRLTSAPEHHRWPKGIVNCYFCVHLSSIDCGGQIPNHAGAIPGYIAGISIVQDLRSRGPQVTSGH